MAQQQLLSYPLRFDASSKRSLSRDLSRLLGTFSGGDHDRSVRLDISNLTVGSRIDHPAHGTGTVTFVGADYVGVAFDESGEALIRRSALKGDITDLALVSEEILRESLPWPASTFVPDTADAQHYMGSHWWPFTEDAQELVARLPALLREALPHFGYGAIERHVRKGRQLPKEWPQGFQLAWPIRMQGLSLIMRIAQDGNWFTSMFPFTSHGVQTALVLREVRVWERGLEAQIEASWGSAEVTFFDSQYAINRAQYEAGRTYDFILAGIAYSARPATRMEWRVNQHPDVVAWMNRRRGPGEPTYETSVTVSTEGAVMLIPSEGRDRDDYSFRASVKSVEPFKQEWLGQHGWRVRAIAMRVDAHDADLDIFITRRAWEDDVPPRVGQEIEGVLWLQGHLWQSIG